MDNLPDSSFHSSKTCTCTKDCFGFKNPEGEGCLYANRDDCPFSKAVLDGLKNKKDSMVMVVPRGIPPYCNDKCRKTNTGCRGGRVCPYFSQNACLERGAHGN